MIVRHAVLDSQLQADHGIPRAMLKQIFPKLTASQRLVARNLFAFARCAGCHRAKGDALPSSRAAIMDLFESANKSDRIAKTSAIYRDAEVVAFEVSAALRIVS